MEESEAARAHHAVVWMGPRGEWRMRTVAISPPEWGALLGALAGHPGAVPLVPGTEGRWTVGLEWVGHLKAAEAGELLAGLPPPRDARRQLYAAMAAPHRGFWPEGVYRLEERAGLCGVVAENPARGWVRVEAFRAGPASLQAAALGQAFRADGMRGPAAACEEMASRMGRDVAPDPMAHDPRRFLEAMAAWAAA